MTPQLTDAWNFSATRPTTTVGMTLSLPSSQRHSPVSSAQFYFGEETGPKNFNTFSQNNRMNSSPDFIVLGSGVAGLRAAAELARAGRVAVLTKDRLDESNTEYAQGGVAVAMSDDDEISLHMDDTLNA